MQKSEYQKILTENTFFQQLSDESKQKISSAEGDSMDYYLQMIAAGNTDVNKTKREFIRDVGDQVDNFTKDFPKEVNKQMHSYENDTKANEQDDLDQLIKTINN